MENPDNILNLNTQPSPEESEGQELVSRIKSIKNVTELAELVYNIDNPHLTRGFHETRLDFLKKVMPNTMSEYQDVTADGFLVKEKLVDLSIDELEGVEKHEPISSIDAVKADEQYLEEAIPELLDALTVSDYDDQAEAA